MLKTNPKLTLITDKLQALPEGLTGVQFAEAIGKTRQSANYWIQKTGYKIRDGRQDNAPNIQKILPETWEKVDWGLKDSTIGRHLNVSRERVRQKRLELNKPKTPSKSKSGFLKQSDARPLVYLSCPYSHPDKNVVAGRFRAANKKAAELIQDGYIVYSPLSHSHPIEMDSGTTIPWEKWMEMDTVMIGFCWKLFVLALPGWDHSKGVMKEISVARSQSLEVVYVDPCL